MANDHTSGQHDMVVVTGATGALGGQVVKVLLQHNFRVLAIGSSEASLKKLETNALLQTAAFDLSNEQEVKKFIVPFLEKKSISAACLLAGGYEAGNLEETDGAALDRQVAINFKTAYLIGNQLFAHMKDKGQGRMILMSAAAALKPSVAMNSVAYALSKNMLVHLSEIWNEAGAPGEVKTFVLAPTVIDTPANRTAMPGADYTAWTSREKIADLILKIIGGKESYQMPVLLTV